MSKIPSVAGTAGFVAAALGLWSCGDASRFEGREAGLDGSVVVDGSSTVYPITEAVAEEFQADHRGVRVSVAISGTTGGFRKFCAGEADIADASRAIHDDELDLCRSNGVEPIEIIVGWDGIALVANPANGFASCLTVEELRRIWEPGSRVSTWNDVRPQWPAMTMRLYGPGSDSGTFDYFTAAIVGEEDASRSDYAASEDDNVLVRGVAGDEGALGYFGYAYYAENTDKLRLLGLDDGQGCVRPGPETIRSREYSPLSRPLFIYVKQGSLRREEVLAFAEFYLGFAREFLPQVGYIPLSADRYPTRIEEIRWRASEERAKR